MPNPGLIRLIVAALAALAVGFFVFSGHGSPEPTAEGWVEGYYLYLSPDEAGRVTKLDVQEGDKLGLGAPLFSLDDELQVAAVAEAEASVANAKINYSRAKDLLAKAVGSQKTYDDAEAAMRTADARLNSARTRLQRRRVASPAEGVVQEIYFRAGEMVAAGRPIISLLPPDNTRIRFYVAQAELPRMQIGQEVTVQCDGCAEAIKARVSFISAEAEFTPPIIYSQEERARLVFRLEAKPDMPASLRVGQPVSVRLPARGSAANAGK